jgi:hypothetical protein
MYRIILLLLPLLLVFIAVFSIICFSVLSCFMSICIVLAKHVTSKSTKRKDYEILLQSSLPAFIPVSGKEIIVFVIIPLLQL